MPTGVVALLHAAAGDAWSWEPWVAVPLVVVAAVYARGVAVLWSHEQHRGVRALEIASFAIGWATLVVALMSPLHALSERLFSAHMVQHELLMVVAAPLLLIGKPMVVLLWAMPPSARRTLARISRGSWWHITWSILSRPADAWLIHAIVIWCWHLPMLFQATLGSDTVHALQHGSFLGSALLFWWAVIHPRRRASLGLSILYLFTTAIHTAALGALMTFARVPWYPRYGSAGATWGLSLIEDQQLAGLVMWIPASFAYLIAALIILRRWLRDSEWRVTNAERAAILS